MCKDAARTRDILVSERGGVMKEFLSTEGNKQTLIDTPIQTHCIYQTFTEIIVHFQKKRLLECNLTLCECFLKPQQHILNMVCCVNSFLFHTVEPAC